MATNSKEKQREYDSRRGKRSRGWACIVYPESAPEGWIEALRGTHLQILISPLHDADMTATGDEKKPHYHVLVMFEQVATEKTAREVFSKIGVTAPPELVRSIRAYARYLVHMDDHDKHRYSESDVMELCGASWAAVALDEAEEKDKLLDEIEDFIDQEGIISYRALTRYARNNRPEWKRVIRGNTIHIKAYLRSFEYDIIRENQGK